ncbi:hypothetical protein ACTXT7_010632 [Hymenolepis weldensis]
MRIKAKITSIHDFGSLATLELQISALKPESKVVIIDDVLAIGGTMSAAVKLCREASLEVLGAGVLLQIVPCKGGQRPVHLKPYGSEVQATTRANRKFLRDFMEIEENLGEKFLF